MTRTLLATAGALVLASGAARAERSPESLQDCAGKLWVTGDKMETPMGERWWPNPLWGEGDEAGSTNWYTKPEVVLRAIAEADQARSTGSARSPRPICRCSARKFALRIPGSPTGGPFGAHQLIYHDEYVATEIGQSAPSSTSLATSGSLPASLATRRRCVTTTAPPKPRWCPTLMA